MITNANQIITHRYNLERNAADAGTTTRIKTTNARQMVKHARHAIKQTILLKFVVKDSHQMENRSPTNTTQEAGVTTKR